MKGCSRKRMLVYLLFYTFIHQSRCAVVNGRTVITVPLAQPTSEELSFPPMRVVMGSAKRENLATGRITEAIHAQPEQQHSVNIDNRRDGYERDLMVVLPVMQGNSDMTNSKLQVLYTKPPVTAIIGDDSKDLQHQVDQIATARAIDRRIDVETSSKEINDTGHPYTDFLVADKPVGNKMRVIEKRIDDESKEVQAGVRHPYTEFLFSKSTTAKTRKSPLDYGYPESFKFVQELNELPKNHKPEWASTDGQEFGEYVPPSTDGTTRGDPFQMFESVKPLEINKLLAPKPAVVASATDSIVEENATEPKKKQESTDAPARTKRPSQKRPSKKPQKSKPSTQKPIEDDDLLPSSTSTLPPTTTFSTTEATSPTTKIAIETENSFLPTPTTGERVAAIVKEILGNTTALNTITSSTASSPNTRLTPSSPTPGLTPVGLNLLWAQAGTASTTQLNPVKIVNEVKPSDLISLSRILGENFQAETSTTKAPDDFLNDEMKNMLLALGIIRSEIAPYMQYTTPKTTTAGNYLFNVFGKRDRATPTVDPLSYITFKKIPIEQERPSRDRLPVSDEMTDLLASFGLVPKRTNPFANSIFSRISRQRRLDSSNTTEEGEESSTFAENHSTTEMAASNDTSTMSFDDELAFLSSNGSSITPAPTDTNADMLTPPIDVNVDMLTDDMKNTLENLGLILPLPYSYQPNRNENGNAHVFQPSAHLDKLGDRQKIEKINEAIEHIRRLSKSKETYKLTVEEIEKRLENVTALLKDNSTTVDDLEDVNDELNTSISNATASKVVETLQKIPIADSPPLSDNFDFNFTSDESPSSSITVINLNSTTDEESSEPNSSTELNINVVMSPPNPLSPEELQHLLETNKNDVKRQQPNDTSSSIATTTTEESVATTIIAESSSSTSSESSESSSTFESSSSSSSTESSTRAESNNAPISDLAESFGGGETASEEPSAIDASTERPNGLYFYLDWNTFLNVGEPDKNPVRIRFAPKAGNARNFLPITVP